MSYNEHAYLSLNSDGFHQITYSEWGTENEEIIICVHGLTGNGHDFNWIAEHLYKKGYRVIAPDIVGRGRSDFLKNPDDYNYNQYLQDLMGLLSHLNISKPKSIDWLGISMGGLLGMILASFKNSPIRRLILDDIGPEAPLEDLELIIKYLSIEYRFQNIAEMEQFMRETRGLSWGPVADEQWPLMAENNARALQDGSIGYAFDYNIIHKFKTEPVGQYDLWHCWDHIDCPVFIIRGSESTIFPQNVAEDMLKRGPGKRHMVDLEVIEGFGHVPALMDNAQHELVSQWLTKTSKNCLAA
jgi:pimeloyl-ACP methyl ester carboxylesterase